MYTLNTLFWIGVIVSSVALAIPDIIHAKHLKKYHNAIQEQNELLIKQNDELWQIAKDSSEIIQKLTKSEE